MSDLSDDELFESLISHAESDLDELQEKQDRWNDEQVKNLKLPSVAKRQRKTTNTKNVDPAVHTERFIESIRFNGHATIRRWQGDWFQYCNGRYDEVSDEDVRARLVLNMKAEYSNVNRNSVNDAYEQVLAELNIGSSKEPHTWIGKSQLAGELICFKNGVGNIDSIQRGQIKPATPEFFNLNATAFDFARREETQKPKTWLGFLDQVMEPEEQKTLKQWFGLCLTQDTSLQKILFLLGPRRSGKGTIGRVQTQLVGKRNCAGPTLSSLSQNFGLQPLIGKQLAIISDARLSRGSSAVITERLLSIAGEDALSVPRKFKEDWNGILKTRVMVMSNELPNLQDASGALPSRFVVIRMPNSYYNKEDFDLGKKLTAEIQGIFWWAFDGLLELREERRLFVSESSKEISAEFEALSSPLKTFIADTCEVTADWGDWVSTDELFDLYGEWAKDEGFNYSTTKGVFVRNFISAANHKPNITKKKDNLGKWFKIVRGVKLS